MGDVLPPGQMPLTTNQQVQEDQLATSRLHPPWSDPGDSPLSQGKQDARLPQKKPESLLSQDQGA